MDINRLNGYWLRDEAARKRLETIEAAFKNFRDHYNAHAAPILNSVSKNFSDLFNLVNRCTTAVSEMQKKVAESEKALSAHIESASGAIDEIRNTSASAYDYATGLDEVIGIGDGYAHDETICERLSSAENAINDLQENGVSSGGSASTSWDNITNKPSSFPTTWEEVENKPSSFPVSWDDITGKPETFPPADHTHDNLSGGGVSTNAQTLEGKTVSEIVTQVLNSIHPIGSIYMSFENVSPATLYGGSWERVKDRFLLAAGDRYSIGEAGGSATVTLTVDQIPPHSHSSFGYWQEGTDGTSAGCENLSDSEEPIQTGTTGGGQPHDNMPPYITCYVWKRVA